MGLGFSKEISSGSGPSIVIKGEVTRYKHLHKVMKIAALIFAFSCVGLTVATLIKLYPPASTAFFATISTTAVTCLITSVALYLWLKKKNRVEEEHLKEQIKEAVDFKKIHS